LAVLELVLAVSKCNIENMETVEVFINLNDKGDEFSTVYNQLNLAGSGQDGGTMRKENINSLY